MTEVVTYNSNRFFPENFYISFLLGILTFLHFSSNSYAQLNIISPVNNQVLQRSKSGVANIPLTAYAYFPYTKIDATLTPIQGNTHDEKQFSFSQDQVRQGFLNTSFQAETGWYQLQMLAYWENGNIDTAIISRVGVGEVFLVTGNSNAMGLPDLGSKNSSDQVVSFNAVNKTLNSENITVAPDEPMQPPRFSPINAKNNIFPSGETSWYWAELGDMLNKKLNTPVLFLNAAWAAANSDNYRDAASGKDAFNMYVGKFWPNRQPYTNIINTVKYMNSSLGLRTILWSHGENDAQLAITEDNYFSNIQTLITNSRRDSGYDIPWVIARNSASTSIPRPYVPVVTAQNRLIALKNYNTHAGPNLDTIQIPRPAQGHFENIAGGVQGLTLAAAAWNRVLTDSMIQAIVPIQPKYAIHTGVTPSKIFPGGSFTLPYVITGSLPANTIIQAELLDSTGKFAALAGSGSENPLKIQIPANIKNGQYKLRLTGTKPILTGTVSDPFLISNGYTKVDYINKITARTVGEETYLSWLVAANAGLRKITIQDNTNGVSFSDIRSFDALENDIHSQLYSFVDQNTSTTTSYYRLKLEYKNGEVAYSSIASIFREGAPADFIVFPNPVTQQRFYLKSDLDQSALQCFLYDVKGSQHPIRVSNSEIPGLILVQPIYNLPTGNYFFKMIRESGVSTQTVLFY